MGCLMDYEQRANLQNEESRYWTNGNSYNGEQHPSLVSAGQQSQTSNSNNNPAAAVRLSRHNQRSSQYTNGNKGPNQ